MLQRFFEQLNSADIGAILLLIWCGIRLILAVFEFVATRNTSKLKKEIAELAVDLKSVKPSEEKKVVTVLQVKNKLPNDVQAVKAQKFSRYMPEYKLDEKTNELVATGGVIDIQEQVQSYVDTCLEKALDKYLTNEMLGYSSDELPDEAFGVREPLNDKLGYAQEAKTYIEELREYYHLPLDATDEQIAKFAVENAENLKNEIAKSQKSKVQKVEEVKKDDNHIDVEEAIAFYKEHYKEG